MSNAHQLIVAQIGQVTSTQRTRPTVRRQHFQHTLCVWRKGRAPRSSGRRQPPLITRQRGCLGTQLR
jgi:hypothetical protein